MVLCIMAKNLHFSLSNGHNTEIFWFVQILDQIIIIMICKASEFKETFFSAKGEPSGNSSLLACYIGSLGNT